MNTPAAPGTPASTATAPAAVAAPAPAKTPAPPAKGIKSAPVAKLPGTPLEGNPRISIADDGESIHISLKVPLSSDKVPSLKMVEAERLKNGVLEVVVMREPCVFDRLAVSKMPGVLGNPIAYEYNLVARITDLPVEALEMLKQRDWENIQDALGKWTD